MAFNSNNRPPQNRPVQNSLPAKTQAPAVRSLNPNPLLMDDDTWKRLEEISKRSARAGYANGNDSIAFMTLLKGIELGFTMIQALERISIINGKACVDGQGLLAVIMGRCPTAVLEKQYTFANERDQRAGIPESVTVTILNVGPRSIVETYTWGMAVTAKLTGKDNWQKHPMDMIFWKAVARAIRSHAPHYIAGIYLKDEMEDARDVTPKNVASEPQPAAEALPAAQAPVEVVAAPKPAEPVAVETKQKSEVVAEDAAKVAPDPAERLVLTAADSGYSRDQLGELLFAWFGIKTKGELTFAHIAKLEKVVTENWKPSEGDPIPAGALPAKVAK